jgi:hypothetical protein
VDSGVTVHNLLDKALVMSGFSDLFSHPVGICLDLLDVSSKIWLLRSPDQKRCLDIELNRAACHRTPDSDLVACPCDRTVLVATFVFLGGHAKTL